MNISHALTFFRIFVSPIFFLVYISHGVLGISPQLLPYILLTMLLLSELSDALDGYLARKYNHVTDLGKLIDPMADSIYRISIFLTFTQPPVSIPILLLFVFIYRDSVISYLRTICALKGFVLAARTSGKAKAVIQAVAAISVTVLLIPYSLDMLTEAALSYWSTWIVSAAAAYTLYTGWDYLYNNKTFIMRLLSSKSRRPRS